MKQPEASLKQKLIEGFVRASRGRGWYTYLTPSMFQKQGLPDLVFGWPGGKAPVWIEGKAEAPVSELQRGVFTKMTTNGLDVRVIRWTAATLALRGKFRMAELSRWGLDGEQHDAQVWSWSIFEQPRFWERLFGLEAAAVGA